MKVHKRLCTALPRPLTSTTSAAPSTAPISRVRSNSAASSRSLYTASSSSLPFSFFDTPATSPPTARPGSGNLIVSTRLAAEVKAEIETHSNSPYSHQGQQNSPHSHSNNSGPPPYSLVFSSGQSDGSAGQHLATHYNLFFHNIPLGPAPAFESLLGGSADAALHSQQQRHTYHLDVGAYGIPKQARKGGRVAGRDGASNGAYLSASQLSCDQEHDHAVQVGEDAYFIRENAMGVADGVGGWSRSRRTTHPDEPTPSALFAHRLMHYCCEEVEAAMGSSSRQASGEPDFSDPSKHSEWLKEQLDDSLEELADGLDVLCILEKAYDKTLRAHVVPPTATSSAQSAPSRPSHDPYGPATSSASSTAQSPANSNIFSSQSSGKYMNGESPRQSPSEEVPLPGSSTSNSTPLMEGSSTALLAILEHPSVPPPKTPKPMSLFHPQTRRGTNDARTVRADRGAVLRIAHLGDCMAMLIRGEEIIWRTEEMWWNFNTPVQLGPASSTRPQDAHTFTIPVQEDDILILASDGLSDNLWDEDILDEVVRFRNSFMVNPSTLHGPRSEFVSSKGIIGRGTLAGMLSEALCSRARCVSERKGCSKRGSIVSQLDTDDDIPFGRRAREEGKWFQGGKPDDISVLVAVVSPVDPK